MASKKSKSARLEAFNRSQEIYRALEKGIIENEALMGSAIDRPESDAHLSELLESTSEQGGRNASASGRRTTARRNAKKSKPAKKKAKRKR